MRLLKLIGIFFIFYFIRRFIQMYKVMSAVQKQQEDLRQQHQSYSEAPRHAPQTHNKNDNVIEADFKVVDR